MKKTIIWDWNGTLLDDLDFCVKVLNQMCRKRNLPLISVEDYLAEFTFPVKTFYEKIGFDFKIDDYYEVSEEFISTYNKGSRSCELQKGALETLSRFKKLGYRQIVLSAMEQNNLRGLIEHFQIEDFFAEICGTTNNFGEGKIKEGKNLLESHASDSNHTYLIGDTLHDIEVADAIGVNCIVVANGHQAVNRFIGKNITVCKTLGDLTILD